MLAISLHAVNDDLRDVLVPINRKWPLAELLDACRSYPRLSNAERITFEYVMLKGVNDSDGAARDLTRLIAGIPAKINLIPFNAWPGAGYERSDWDRIEGFAEIVNRAGYASPVRTPRGQDILAACGQLKSATERGRKSRAEIAAEAAVWLKRHAACHDYRWFGCRQVNAGASDRSTNRPAGCAYGPVVLKTKLDGGRRGRFSSASARCHCDRVLGNGRKLFANLAGADSARRHINFP